MKRIIQIFIYEKDDQILSSSKYQILVNERTNGSINFSSELFFDAVLRIFNVTKSDYGLYRCKIENSLGFDQNDITLSGLSKLIVRSMIFSHLFV